MTPGNSAMRREGGSKTRDALITKNSDAEQDATVVTLGGILKFTLFFMACLAFALLLLVWDLRYFYRLVTR